MCDVSNEAIAGVGRAQLHRPWGLTAAEPAVMAVGTLWLSGLLGFRGDVPLPGSQ